MLEGWQIAILRPPHQAHALFERIKALQGEPILAALYDIAPLSILDETLLLWCELMNQADLIFIASANALWCAPKKLISAIGKKSLIITMGKATTQALEDVSDRRVHYTAPPGYTSEKLLAQSFFHPQKVHEKRIALLAGIGGRTLLANVLQSRGAYVSWMKVYEKQQILFDLSEQFFSWQAKERFCFIATSSHILAGLVQLAPQENKSWLFTRPLVVLSERTRLQAKEWGFKHIFVASNPHLEGMEHILHKVAAASLLES